LTYFTQEYPNKGTDTARRQQTTPNRKQTTRLNQLRKRVRWKFSMLHKQRVFIFI